LPTGPERDLTDTRIVKVARLTRRSEFLRVAGMRCKWAAPGLILQAAPSIPPSNQPMSMPAADGHPSTGGVLRVGFTCSKKVGNSVARNRAKRRLRAVVAAVLPTQGQPGFDYVVIGRKETLDRPYALLLQDLQTALKRVGSPRKGGGRDKPQGRQDGQEGP
jgi:ribonuclease P protein component